MCVHAGIWTREGQEGGVRLSVLCVCVGGGAMVRGVRVHVRERESARGNVWLRACVCVHVCGVCARGCVRSGEGSERKSQN